jgi:hypothetical protein
MRLDWLHFQGDKTLRLIFPERDKAKKVLQGCPVVFKPARESLLKGMAQYSWPPHLDTLFCNREKKYFQK